LDRRDFLSRTGVALAGSVLAAGRPDEATSAPAHGAAEARPGDDWERVRADFALADDVVHMSAMLLASHPRPVREAIERHRRGLDANPVAYLADNYGRLTEAARAAAGRYVGVKGDAIALTDSTTMGLGLVYNGLRLRPDQEILSTEHDFYVTHASIRLAAARTGASIRKIALYDRIADVSGDQIVDRIARAVGPKTRVLALTWVHSSTGLKLPLRRIGGALAHTNASRPEEDRILFCVDGVHGFGNQDLDFADLGCDFLIAGCHKWLFGPRGTGIVAGTEAAWRSLLPTIPSFIDGRAWSAWTGGGGLPEPVTAATMTPGGFKPFEHVWALPEAFAWQEAIGQSRVRDRTHALAGQLKDGLAGIRGVRLHTPRAEALSAGIVSFDLDGSSPHDAVKRLRERKIVASVAPYATPHVRLTPSICNTPAEVDAALRAVREIAG
jgi:selenocysteine lyase/cysteine desulfurase